MLDPVELFPEIANIYDFPSVHADLVFDQTRVRAYREAINATVNKGDVVADLGAGTGLLTFLCLQAGARRVHAIERSEVINWAREIADRNAFSSRIVFHECDAREAQLNEQVDVLVSELMGHAAFEEGMAETISVAKNHFLAPNGRIIPRSVTLKAALANQEEVYRNYIDVWRQFDGIDYSPMREKAVRGTYLLNINPDHVCSDSRVVVAEDFTDKPRNLEKTIIFKCKRAGPVNGLVFWFDAKLTSTIFLSSEPNSQTHWMQCFAPLQNPLSVSRSEEIPIAVQIRFRNNPNDPFLFQVSCER